MNPLCLAVLASCAMQPTYLPPPAPPPMPRSGVVFGRPPPPPELPPGDPAIAPAPHQYFEPAPDRVWSRVHAKTYYCPGSPEYGQKRGVYLTEADARMSGFGPAAGHPCFGTAPPVAASRSHR